MIAWLLVALAQEPTTFAPVPGEEVVGGKKLEGILIDEATFAELGRLRVEAAAQQDKLLAFESWKETQDSLFLSSLQQTQQTCQENMLNLQNHYDKALDKASKKDALQRHSFPLGVAVGVVASTAVYAAATRFYGEVLGPTSVE